MVSYCALAILAVLVGANAQIEPCSKQMESEHRCMLTVETSPEATMIKDRMKQVKKTCVPDYPAECHAQMEAAHDCMVSIAKNADTDPLFTESKSKSQPAVDQCFEKYPPDVKKGFEEIFMMKHKPQFHHKKHWNKHGNDTASGESTSAESTSAESESGESNSNETSSSLERRHGGKGKGGGGGRHHGGGGGGGGSGGRGGGGRGGGGRGGRGGRCHHHGRHGPKNFTSSESNSNETSASSESGDRSGGKSGESGEKDKPSQCRKTPEQKQCIKDELKKLAKDSSFIDVMNTLIKQKKKCKQLVSWSCDAKCPKKQKCIYKATKPCREAFMERMKTCLQEKGFTLPPFMMRGDHTGSFTTPLPVLQH